MLLAEAIQQLAGTKFLNIPSLVLAEVVTVDADARTCVCQAITGKTTADLSEVLLMPVSDDGFLYIPAIGSTVLIGYANDVQPCIIMFSELDAATLWVNGVITLKDGSLGGIPIVSSLVARLNSLENAFNELNIKVNGLAPTPVIPNLTLTQANQIENLNVTHG